MRDVDGVVPDAMQSGEGVREGRVRGSRKEFARRALLEYRAHYIHAGVHSSSALEDPLRSFRNANSRRESAQVFRVCDARDCAMGLDASSGIDMRKKQM